MLSGVVWYVQEQNYGGLVVGVHGRKGIWVGLGDWIWGRYCTTQYMAPILLADGGWMLIECGLDSLKSMEREVWPITSIHQRGDVSSHRTFSINHLQISTVSTHRYLVCWRYRVWVHTNQISNASLYDLWLNVLKLPFPQVFFKWRFLMEKSHVWEGQPAMNIHHCWCTPSVDYPYGLVPFWKFLRPTGKATTCSSWISRTPCIAQMKLDLHDLGETSKNHPHLGVTNFEPKPFSHLPFNIL